MQSYTWNRIVERFSLDYRFHKIDCCHFITGVPRLYNSLGVLAVMGYIGCGLLVFENLFTLLATGRNSKYRTFILFMGYSHSSDIVLLSRSMNYIASTKYKGT